MNRFRVSIVMLAAVVVASCSESPLGKGTMTVEQAAMDERISRHFDGVHYSRYFFIDRHSEVDASSITVRVDATTMSTEDGGRIELRWAAVGDPDGNLLGMMFGSTEHETNVLVPFISKDDFRDEWKKCKGDWGCQDRLVDKAIKDCDDISGMDPDCPVHCWWWQGITVCLKP